MRCLLVLVFMVISSTVFAGQANDLNVSNLQHIETKRGAGYVFLSFKMDVENSGEKGKVFVEILGKNADGFQLHSVHADGIVNSNDKTVLTTTTAVGERQYRDITTWEIGRTNKYVR